MKEQNPTINQLRNNPAVREQAQLRREASRNVAWNAMLLAAIFALLLSLAACSETPDPVPLESIPAGTWIETTKIAEADGEAHSVRYIVDRFVREADEVAAVIEAYNLSAAGQVIKPLENPDLEFCLMEYRVKYPKDFPQERYGIMDVAIPFKVVSVYGGVIQVDGTAYPNLSDTAEIGKQPQGYDFHRGDTYHGIVVFAMVKDFDGYLIQEVRSDDAGEEPAVLIRGE